MVGLATTQRVAAYPLRGEVDLAAYEAMGRVMIDEEGVTEQTHPAVLAGAPEVEQPALGMRLQVELPGTGKRPATRCRLNARGAAAAQGGDVAR